MAISKTRILDNAVAAIENAGKYAGLSGSELDDAKAATREGLAFLVDAIVDELVANAVVSGTAATDGLPVNGVPEVVGDAAVTGGIS